MSEEVNSASQNIGPGDKLAGYRIGEQVGQGGMAVVYRAHDERLDRQVALKVLAPALSADPAFRARFVRESRSAAAVDHRHILPVYDTGDADGVLFIAMRYIAGGDVRTLFAGGQVLALARVWHIASQVADALDAAHGHNLIHRDVKPANILIDVPARSTSGRIDHVYLTDFGVSAHGVTSHLTSTGHFVGSLAYISPEQIEAKTVQGFADQYSLACATYEMLAGEPPFTGDSAIALINAQLTMPPPALSAKRPGLAPAVDLVLAKAMAKTPEQRYPTCCDFTDDLGKALGVMPGTPSVVGDPQDTTSAASASAGSGAPLSVPTPTEVTNPSLLQSMSGAATGPGQSPPSPAPGYGVVPPAPTPGYGIVPPGYGMVPPAPAPGYGTVPPAPPPGYGVVPPAPGYGMAPPGYGVVSPMPPPGSPWATPGPPARKDRGALVAALIAAVVVVLAAAGTVAFVATRNTASSAATTPAAPSATISPPVSAPTSEPVTSPPEPTAAPAAEQTEVAAVNGLLTNSGISRTELQSTVADIGSCLNAAADVSQLDAIVSERQTQLSDAQSLQVDAIPDGAEVQSDLVAALTASIAADNDYLNWAEEQNSNDCETGVDSTYYQDAEADDGTASSNKATFESAWTPLADQYGYNPDPYF